MPSFGFVLSETEIEAVVHYVRTLPRAPRDLRWTRDVARGARARRGQPHGGIVLGTRHRDRLASLIDDPRSGVVRPKPRRTSVDAPQSVAGRPAGRCAALRPAWPCRGLIELVSAPRRADRRRRAPGAGAPRRRHLGGERVDLRDPAARGAAGGRRTSRRTWSSARRPSAPSRTRPTTRCGGRGAGHARLRRPGHRRRHRQRLVPDGRHGDRALRPQTPARCRPLAGRHPDRPGRRRHAQGRSAPRRASPARPRSTWATCGRCSPWPRWAP